MKQLHLSEACISHSWAPGLGEGPKGPSVNIWSSYQRPSSSSILFDLLSSCLTSLHHLTLPCAPSPKRSHQGDEGRRSRQGHLLFWPRKYWSLVTRQSIRPQSLGSLSLSLSLSFCFRLNIRTTVHRQVLTPHTQNHACVVVVQRLVEELHRTVSPSCTELRLPFLLLRPCPVLHFLFHSCPSASCLAVWFMSLQRVEFPAVGFYLALLWSSL